MLTPEQKQQVAAWVAAGDSLSAIQKKLRDEFQLSMTYMDVRFLVDDLQLQLKDPAPKTDANLQPAAPPPHTHEDIDEDDTLPEDPEENAHPEDKLPSDAPSSLSVEVDNVTLDPAAIASGSVRFSDGVTGKWMINQQGRPALTEVSQPNYRPTQTDAQTFMQKLAAALREKGIM